MRALLAILVLLIAHPLAAQPVPEGDKVRVREGKGAPWSTGFYTRSDSASMVLMQAGINRTYELLSVERIEWRARLAGGRSLDSARGRESARARRVAHFKRLHLELDGATISCSDARVAPLCRAN